MSKHPPKIRGGLDRLLVILGTAHFGGSKRPIWRTNFCKSSVKALMYTEHREKGKYFGRNAPNEGSAYTMASKGAQDGKKSE